MLKSYTFKVMGVADDTTKVICCIHCPLEVFYESFKKTSELTELYHNTNLTLYVKVTDIPSDNGINENIYKLCTFEPLVNSNSFKEFLCCTNVLDLETLEPTDELIEDFVRLGL